MNCGFQSELEDLISSMDRYAGAERAMRLRALAELSDGLETDALLALAARISENLADERPLGVGSRVE